ncbi:MULTISPECIES: hypothetical protein [unclassified Methanoculleus]|jgi:2,3-bisphosphoglycerate-independent phosphoglycerate mutase|uniref:Uncharacterized protein n=2 Tax=Methanoculleus TaxID=45989 RepID=A0ABD8A6C9_9EURY|nr:hypothetical protein R6Y95_06005 [Methanoculleus palmolei]
MDSVASGIHPGSDASHLALLSRKITAPTRWPVVIRGPGVRTDRFDEVSCVEGDPQRIRGGDLMPIVPDLINKSHKYGA